MIFEGEYLKGVKWNGKGKEFDDEGFERLLVFEGEYLNGKRNGKVKEYYPKGQLKFKGEYLNGKINGKGKEYILDKLIYDVKYLNGEKNG